MCKSTALSAPKLDTTAAGPWQPASTSARISSAGAPSNTAASRPAISE